MACPAGHRDNCQSRDDSAAQPLALPAGRTGKAPKHSSTTCGESRRESWGDSPVRPQFTIRHLAYLHGSAQHDGMKSTAFLNHVPLPGLASCAKSGRRSRRRRRITRLHNAPALPLTDTSFSSVPNFVFTPVPHFLRRSAKLYGASAKLAETEHRVKLFMQRCVGVAD